MNKKKKIIVKVRDLQFIHYNATNKGSDKIENTTIMKGKFAIPWHAITDVPITEKALQRVEKLKKLFPDVSIEFNYLTDKPAFILGVSGKTVRHEGDKLDWSIGNKVAKAKTMAKACVVSKHIAIAIKEGLEEELNRTIGILNVWYEKEKRIIKGM